MCVLLISALAVACDDNDAPAPSVTPASSATRQLTATPEPAADLASLIGPRADLRRNDPFDLAARYGETPGRAPASIPFAGEAQAGAVREFIVVRITGGASGPPPVVTRINAMLLARTGHAYFFVDDSLGADASGVQASADVFEQETWPVVTGVFGEPPSPGVDSDPRMVVLVADLGGVGGYHSADDLYPRAVRPLSNQAEMVYIDSSLAPGSGDFDVVLAHELQHLILEQNDGDEEAWVNEGLSVTAEGLVGGSMSVIGSFEERPFTQLNRWEYSGNLPHYGAGGAFFRYLAARFGGDAALGRIAATKADGPAGIDEFLAAARGDTSFRAAFADWLAANVLNRAEGPYANPPARPLDVTIDRSLAVGDTVDAEAAQFGADYYEIEGVGAGAYELRFDGAAEVDVLPISPDDGGAFFWSNSGDGINTTLTREADLHGVASPGLTFETWYDIEPHYDRGYVSVSTDGGATWRALPATSSRTSDPVELYYGPGFDGRSGDPLEPEWVTETVDLNEFAGTKILMRFEYVTDGGTHGEAWAIRNVSSTSGSGAGGQLDLDAWISDGWVRIDRALPQAYVARLIGERADGEAVVLDVPLDAQGDGVLRFTGEGLTDLTLAVAGATEGTNQLAPYTIELRRAD